MEDRMLTTREVALRFRVHPATIRRWAANGRLREAQTPGRHGRFWESDVRAALQKPQDENGTARASDAGQPLGLTS